MSDPTRRSLLTRVCQEGPCRVTDLAAFYDISLNAVSKHIKVLEKCELITRTTSGRVHWIEANLDNIKIVENWFKELKSIWELRLDKLTELMENETEK
ncbi:MAG: helix-turn-helix transcriptional regulator [Pseudomonadales bacterium]|nr:helix-turn-helix transcriptional regulator [Pseudomonadales bacterium]